MVFRFVSDENTDYMNWYTNIHITFAKIGLLLFTLALGTRLYNKYKEDQAKLTLPSGYHSD
jgi:hypothetical protein